MTEGIIVAIIAGVVSSIGSGLSFLATQKAKKDNLMKEQEKANKDLKEEFQKSIGELQSTLKNHRDEYMEKIGDVEKTIAKMEGAYQVETNRVEMKIENLEKAQNAHNNLIARTYAVEQKTAVHDEMIRVANHRIADLEEKKKATE